MDVFLLLVFLCVIWVLFSRLSRPNPFDRVLFRREYVLSGMSPHREVDLSFTKHSGVDSSRKAFFHIKYSYPDAKRVTFSNLPDCNRLSIPFFFERLDFSQVSYVPNFHYFLDGVSSAHLPCSELVLPKNMKLLLFDIDCSSLSLLDIPSPVVVPVYVFDDPTPISVCSGFKIRVPRALLSAYEADTNWSALRFEDENGDIFPPRFFSYLEC